MQSIGAGWQTHPRPGREVFHGLAVILVPSSSLVRHRCGWARGALVHGKDSGSTKLLPGNGLMVCRFFSRCLSVDRPEKIGSRKNRDGKQPEL